VTTKQKVWAAVILAATGLAIGLELLAAFDGSSDTDPWTDLIVRYIPQEITVTAVAVLAAWLPVHFAARYPKRPGGPQKLSARGKHVTAAVVAGLVALQAAVTDDGVTAAEWVGIAVAVAGALGVYAMPNAPDASRRAVPLVQARGRGPV
jgi:peptidoglycan/LPS O-acetylase OafA/YrhL